MSSTKEFRLVDRGQTYGRLHHWRYCFQVRKKFFGVWLWWDTHCEDPRLDDALECFHEAVEGHKLSLLPPEEPKVIRAWP